MTDSSVGYRERVCEAFADRHQPFGTAVESALEAGVGRLGLEIGFLTRIEDGTQYIEHAAGDHGQIHTDSCRLFPDSADPGVDVCRK